MEYRPLDGEDSGSASPLIGATDIAAVDVYTVAHAAFGYLAGLIGLPLPITLLVAALFEWAEPELEQRFPEYFTDTIETRGNAAFDVAAAGIAWLIAERQARH